MQTIPTPFCCVQIFVYKGAPAQAPYARMLTGHKRTLSVPFNCGWHQDAGEYAVSVVARDCTRAISSSMSLSSSARRSIPEPMIRR